MTSMHHTDGSTTYDSTDMISVPVTVITDLLGARYDAGLVNADETAEAFDKALDALGDILAAHDSALPVVD